MNNDDQQIEDIFSNLEKKEKHSKSRKNSSRKGKRGEQKIGNLFKEQFNLPFSRVPQSGAIGTRADLTDEAKKILSGDIITPDNFCWSLENKTGYDIDIINLFSVDQGKKTDRT